jgi:alkylated DNA repair dioxygenase AlkB
MLFQDYSHNLLPIGGELYYCKSIFNEQESRLFLDELITSIPWKQEPIMMFGKSIMQPRLTALYGNEGMSYGYSGIRMPATIWTNTLLLIKDRVEQITQTSFNVALLNRYRDANDSMGWHRDNEKELGMQPVIASVSFGAARAFQIRPYKTKEVPHTICLDSGSLLLMKGDMQTYWEHQLPKSRQSSGTRINITFRKVLEF